MRTCEGFGVTHVFFSGYTPFPDEKLSPSSASPIRSSRTERRLPHITEKLTKQISKTALGAERLIPFTVHDTPPISELKALDYRIVALEQGESSINLKDFKPNGKILLVVGEEVDGIHHDLLEEMDMMLEIPMQGQKESFNVSVATGIALYQICT